MGGIWFDGAGFRGTVSELIGKKSGFALSLDELLDNTPEEHREALQIPDSKMLRIRSEVFQELVCGCLYSLGTLSTPYIVMPGMELLLESRRRLDHSDRLLALHNFILEKSSELFRHAAEEGAATIDPSSLLEEVSKQYGREGCRWALRYLTEIDTYQRQSILTAFTRAQGSELLNLNELFESESVETPEGGFIDQRFVDYLQVNPERLFEMNWRKFEGLAAEWFDRNGYHVEIGPGRNDGGVDIRVWESEGKAGSPPVILIQCKRYKNAIDQIVVKSLWADVLHEKAKTGLVVTTSRLSPSAEKVARARAYNVDAADGETLRSWLLAMRTPDSGVFMSH